MKSQDDENEKRLQKQINEILRSAIAKRTYRSGIVQIQQILKKEGVKKPNSKTLYQLGFLSDHVAFFQEKNPVAQRIYEQQALSYYRHALKLDPRDPAAIWGIGRVWWHRKDKRALFYAKKAYQLAKSGKYDFGPFGQHIAFIYEQLFKKYALAERWHLRALREERKRTVWSYANLIQFYTNLRKDDQARQLAKKMDALFQKESSEFQTSLSGKMLSKIISKALKKDG